jgi:glycine/D-amino acid oxidase-like deaminating enzyme
LKGRLPISTIVHSLDGIYIVPWGRGEYLVGSTVERAGFKPHPTKAGIQKIMKGAARLLPAIADLKTKTAWAGLRPLAKNRFPLIGPTPVRGYYWAAGYYRSGILIGNFVGKLLAQGILSGKWPRLLAPFSPLKLFRV